MVIDSSAIIAALAGEPDAGLYRDALKSGTDCAMSAVNVFETRLVLERRYGVAMGATFEALLDRASVRIAPFDSEQVTLARYAYSRFGKGTGHPAQLNLGDCAAYALARYLDDVLLFKGRDFALTDVRPALT